MQIVTEPAEMIERERQDVLADVNTLGARMVKAQKELRLGSQTMTMQIETIVLIAEKQLKASRRVDELNSLAERLIEEGLSSRQVWDEIIALREQDR